MAGDASRSSSASFPMLCYWRRLMPTVWVLCCLLLLHVPLSWCFPTRVAFYRYEYARKVQTVVAAKLPVGNGRKKSSKSRYTLQFSPSFRRHVVRDQHGRVVKSFLWLDEALDDFPGAKLLPVEPLRFHCSNETSYGHVANEPILAAGGFFWDQEKQEFCGYPIHPSPTPKHSFNKTFNRKIIVAIFESQLKWFPSQVEQLIQLFPEIVYYAPSELHERIRFLLSPLPDHAVVEQVNYTDDIDWPVQFHTLGRGAGMSVAQVSHALLTLPQSILRLPQIPSAEMAAMHMKQLSFLYEQTPSVVSQITHERLEAWLAGTTMQETAVLAYFHWKGWEWTQCRLLLHAWPCLLQPALEPGWEVYERGGKRGGVRKHLMPDALFYLQARLQLRPWHVQAMFKTHSRLTGYNAGQLQRNMDFLQESLVLSCSDLRNLLLQMPSLLGASIDGLKERIVFWLEEVHLTMTQLRLCALKKPALLQYSVSANLRPKLAFYAEELGIDCNELIHLTASFPDIWAYSLDQKLRPSCANFIDRCGEMTAVDYGQIIVKAPDLVRCSWTSNLSIKMDFLQDNLDLSQEDLKAMVQATPRVLLHSTRSLGAKIGLLKEAGGSLAGCTIIQRNPSLLLTSLGVLKNRVHKASHNAGKRSLLELLAGSPAGQGSSRTRRSVDLLSSDGEVEQRFGGVAEAARHASTSAANMYGALRSDRLVRGRKYVYSETGVFETDLNGTCQENVPSLDTSLRKANLVSAESSDPQSQRLTILVSGVAFPPDAGIRGRRRSGGMALQVPTWSINNWRKPCSTIWKGQKLRLLPDGRTLILGYTYTRPSRPRCSLYAVREAIRVASQWVAAVDTPAAEIEILSDSSYVLDMLQNMTEVLEWGRAENRDEFVYTGAGPLYKANPDILYPVARSLYHLFYPDDCSDSSKKNISLRFAPAGRSDSYRCTLGGARLAAKLMYDRAR